MVRRVEVDPVLLGDAAKLVAEIGDTLASVRGEMSSIMGNTDKACGNDHFGEEFAGGAGGFRRRCETVEEKVGELSEVVAGSAEDMGGARGAAQAHVDTDESSSETFG